MSQDCAFAIRAIIGAVGGFLYFALLMILGAIEGGAGHGSYFILTFTGVPAIGDCAPLFWIVYGLLFVINQGTGVTSKIVLVFLFLPYGFLFWQEIKDPYGDAPQGFFWIAAIIVLASQISIFAWWHRKRMANLKHSTESTTPT